MNEKKNEVDFSFHSRGSHLGSQTLSLQAVSRLGVPTHFSGGGCIVHSLTKGPTGPQLVGTKLCVTARVGVVRGVGGDGVGSLSVRTQRSVPDQLLRLVNFINMDILPRDGHF